MSVSSDRKSNNPFLSRPPIVADELVQSGAGTLDNAMQQQMYAPQPGSARQENYDLELPPPAYDSTVRNAGTRDQDTDAPSESMNVPPGRPVAYEAFAGPSRYGALPAGPQSVREGFGVQTSHSEYPNYMSSAPPRPSMSLSRNLLSLAGESSTFLNQLTQSPRTPLPSYRPPAQNLFYTAFPPTYLISNGENLDSGFPLGPPPSPVQPHPFISHDVNEADWTGFLGDLKQSATMSGGERLAAGGAGLVVPSFVIGMIVSTVIKKSMQYNKNNTVGDLVDSWNHHFFRPRQLEVILAKGQDRVDNGSGPVPYLDPQIELMATRLAQSYSGSLSAPPSRRDRRQHRQDRKERRHEEKGQRRGGEEQRYRLFVVSL